MSKFSFLAPHIFLPAMASLVAGSVSAGAAAIPAENTTRPPNIVFILADDLGYGDVKCFNPEGKIPTPNLDRLAASGMALTEAHSSSAVCTPSRYSILTGRYNWRSSMKQGVLNAFSPPLIEEGRLTVAEMLHRQGYHTAAIGKWHLGLGWPKRAGVAEDKTTPGAENLGRSIDFTGAISRAPTTLGFDQFFGISASLDMPPYTFIANDHVAVVPTEEKGLPWIEGSKSGKLTRVGPAAAGFKSVDVLPTLTQHAVEYIDRQAAARDGQPYFLYLPLNSPHTPIAPTEKWRGKSGLNPYADFVMETDAAVGEVLDAIQRSGQADNTLVIFTSDNGCSPEADIPFLNAHDHYPSAGRRGYKADIYDGGHRIPLIVRWPGHVAPATRRAAFICLGDFMATCADILRLKLPDTAAEDSISFLPVLSGESKAGARDTLVLHSINGSFGIRRGQWKLELCPDSGGWSFPRPGKDPTDGLPRFQLFDVVADPAEAHNVLSEHPDVVAQLGHVMKDYIAKGRSTPGAEQKNTASAKWPQTAWVEQFK